MKQALTALLFALAVSASACASPIPVDVALTGVGGQSFDGHYTFPYFLTVTGGLGNINGLCDTYDGTALIGTTWTASLIDLTGGNITGTYFQSLGVLCYEEAGYIYRNFLFSDPVNASVAIWKLFAQDVPPDLIATNMDILAAENASLSDLNGMYAITPTFAGGQEFLGENYTVVPEPTSLMLLGSGILGLALVLRKRLLV